MYVCLEYAACLYCACYMSILCMLQYTDSLNGCTQVYSSVPPFNMLHAHHSLLQYIHNACVYIQSESLVGVQNVQNVQQYMDICNTSTCVLV